MTEETKKIVLESGIEVKPVYGQQDVATGSAEEKIGNPGEYPFTRGIHSLMYRKRPFTMRQYSGFASAIETNERFKFLIDQGQTGLNVAFDLPTQMGLDSDDEKSFGEVGRVGMAVDSLADMEIAFDGIPLDKITVSLTINAVAIVLMGMYFAMAEKQGYDLKSLRGTAQNDILKEFVGRGTWIFPVEPSIRLIGDTIEFCAQQVPKYSPVSVCGYHIRESGADPVQEMAYAFGIARAYADEALRRGLHIDEFAGRLSFNFDIFGNLFEQVAKFRAGRRYWARILKDAYGAKDPRSMWLRMIAGGGGGGLTIEQPENNIVRGAYYALISALSGTQTMALCSYDEAYTIPSEKAALISLRTMQILIEEMGLADTVDPLGGSYYVEALTDEMEKRIEACLENVIEQGGMVKLVADGTIQRQVARQAYQTEKNIQSGEIRKVGVNCYRTEEKERTVELHSYDENATTKQQERVGKIRAERSQDKVERCLAEVRKAAENGENLMPPIIDAVKAYATLGEITVIMKEVFGEFKEPVGF
jgi:methylmalonyl-CoA mutase N-terminal domain/subunit